MRFGILTAVSFALATYGSLIPPERLTRWTPAIYTGVIGGIPTNRVTIIDVTQAPYNADNTGATDASAAILSAFGAAVPGVVFYLPPGTYRADSSMTITPFVGGGRITVRGAGNTTKIKPTGAASAFGVVSSGGHDYQPSVITNGLSKGSTNIMVADAPWYPTNTLVHLYIPDTDRTNIFNVYGTTHNRRQQCLIRAISGNTLTIWPPLYDDYPTNVIIEFSQQQVNSVGIENMVIDMTDSTSTFPVEFGQTWGCWMKGVTISNVASYCIFIYDSANFEMRECVIGPAPGLGSNKAGLLHNYASGSLIENNVFKNVAPLIEVNQGSSGIVFGYNFGIGGVYNINHGPHNSLNLYEGNIGVFVQSDGYFGGASKETLFRNWFHGDFNGVAFPWVGINRLGRDYSLVGNILGSTNYTWPADYVSLGNPNIGNSSYYLPANTGNAWRDWGISSNVVRRWSGVASNKTSATSGTVWFPADVLASLTNVSATSHETNFSTGNVGGIFGSTLANFSTLGAWLTTTTIVITNMSHPGFPDVGGSFVLTPGPAGFQELDLDVSNSLIREVNFNFFNGAIPTGEALGGETLSNSLYRVVAPEWFGSLQWPPFNPLTETASQTGASYDDIPAGQQYLGSNFWSSGSDPEEGGQAGGATSITVGAGAGKAKRPK